MCRCSGVREHNCGGAERAFANVRLRLPKTVIDVNLVYTLTPLKDNDGQAQMKITPSLTARAVADGPLQKVSTNTLRALFEDRNITVSTYAGSHILKSVGSNPVNQTGSIIGSVITGVGRLVAVGLGIPAVVPLTRAAAKNTFNARR